VTSRLLDRLGRIGRPRVLVIGDVLLDRYHWGDVSRISPEAPIPILHVKREEYRLGGAANVARNASALGARVACAGVLGDDPAAREVRRLFRLHRIDGRALVADRSRPTPVKTRMIAHAQQMLRVDQEHAVPVAPPVERALLAAVRRLGRFDLAVLSDYHKGALTPAGVRALVAHFRRRGVPVLAGLKRIPFAPYRGVTGASLNTAELGHAAGRPVRSDAEILRAGRALTGTLGADFVLVTRGERGMTVVPRKGAPDAIASRAREVYDVTGAGDTVLAVLSVALAGGTPLADAARLANAAAGVVVGKVGTESVSRDELALALSEGHAPHARKVVDARTLAARLAAHRARGERVVFTNGCFDLLHAGHAQTLAFAKAQGDVLVVALNADRSVRRLKGPERPLVPQGARATMLAALESVDYVVVFDTPTPLPLLRAIRPDVLVKGSDRGEVVGAVRRFVESTGARLVLAPVVKGFSTTGLVERIRAGKG
jgi:D-beta-D-heptose 7-phosphate kinase/D-beta-D-heptose 1-phosphate adenosyltransferase